MRAMNRTSHELRAVLASAACWGLPACWLAGALLLGGCSATSQTYSAQVLSDPTSASLQAGDLEAFGIAFVTPSTVTGQEEDKPALAQAFAKALETQRPKIHVVPLTETLTDVNRAGLFDSYERMIVEYRDAGLLQPATLAQVGKATGARYIAVLNMAAFQQVYHDRLGVFGLRLLQTKEATIRLTLQIWNCQDGGVAWQGAEEMHMADETAAEDAVSFGVVVQAAADRLAAKIP